MKMIVSKSTLSRPETKLLLLSVLSGVLIGTSFIPHFPWALTFFLVPLWWVWLQPDVSARGIFVSGWLTQFIFSLIGGGLFFNAAQNYSHHQFVFSLICVLLYCTFAHLHFPLSGLTWYFLFKKSRLNRPQKLLGLALIWCLWECYWPYKIKWNFGGPWLYGRIPVFQWAEFVGLQGLSLLTLLMNAWILLVVLHRKNRIRAASLLAGAALFLLCLNIGGIRLGERWKDSPASIDVLLVKPNPAPHSFLMETSMIPDFFEMTKTAVREFPHTDLVIWPESAYPYFLGPEFKDLFTQRRLRRFVASIHKNLLLGAFSRDPLFQEGIRWDAQSNYNAAFLLDPNGRIRLPIYRKIHPIAFFEQMPGENWFPFLRNFIYGGDGGLSAGKDPVLFDVNGARLAPQICNDTMYPELSARLSKMGADVFVLLSNAGVMDDRYGPAQHLAFSLGRAIENRRPMIIASHVGYSTVMNADGTIQDLSTVRGAWVRDFKVPYRRNAPLTFFSRHSDHLNLALFVALGALILSGAIRHRKFKLK